MQPYEPPRHGMRTFVIVWITQSVSVLGSGLTFFAVAIWLTQVKYPLASQKPELAFALAVISVASGAPGIFAAPIAGAWADRHDRKRTMMAMDAASGVIDLALLGLLVSHALQLWMLAAILVIAGTASAFHSASFDTSYAMLVPERHLPRANGMMQTIFSLAGIVTPALAATIIALPVLARQGAIGGAAGVALKRFTDGTPLAIGIDTLTFFMAAAVPFFLAIPSPQRADRTGDGKLQTNLWADVRFGVSYIWQRRPLLWLLGTFTVSNFAVGALVLDALIVRFNLHGDWAARGFIFATAYAVLTSTASLGGVIGGVFISAWGGLKRRRVYGILVPLIVNGLAFIVFGLSPFLFLTAAMGAIEACMVPIMNAHSQAIWQTQVPREMQGRVFSVRRLIAQFTFPLSTFVLGSLGGFFNPGLIFVVLGSILVLVGIGQFWNPSLLHVEDTAWIERLATARSAIE